MPSQYEMTLCIFKVILFVPCWHLICLNKDYYDIIRFGGFSAESLISDWSDIAIFVIFVILILIVTVSHQPNQLRSAHHSLTEVPTGSGCLSQYII